MDRQKLVTWKALVIEIVLSFLVFTGSTFHLFLHLLELALYLCPPDVLRMAILSPNQGVPWKPWLSVLVSPASTGLGALLPALKCSVSEWRLRANWNPSKAREVPPTPALSEVCPGSEL